MRVCKADHERGLSEPGPLNWLDWQCPDDKCPRCGGDTEWFKGAALGQFLDKIPNADAYGSPVPGSGQTFFLRPPKADAED